MANTVERAVGAPLAAPSFCSSSFVPSFVPPFFGDRYKPVQKGKPNGRQHGNI